MTKKTNNVTAVLYENKTAIENPDFISQYHTPKSYGEIKNKKLYLSLYETSYLQTRKKLNVVNKNGKKLNEDDLLKLGLKLDKRFLSRQMVYDDLRDRGYPVRTGLSYGVDFRAYPRGKSMEQAHTQYLIHVLAEDQKFDVNEITRAIRLAHGVKTQLILAVVDHDSTIRYYKTEWFKP